MFLATLNGRVVAAALMLLAVQAAPLSAGTPEFGPETDLPLGQVDSLTLEATSGVWFASACGNREDALTFGWKDHAPGSLIAVAVEGEGPIATVFGSAGELRITHDTVDFVAVARALHDGKTLVFSDESGATAVLPFEATHALWGNAFEGCLED